MFAAGPILLWLDPQQMPSGCETVGDLVRKAAVLNAGRLAKAGASLRDDELWNALRDVLVEHTNLPRDAIGYDTRLLSKRRWAA